MSMLLAEMANKKLKQPLNSNKKSASGPQVHPELAKRLQSRQC
jgi:hypothetical protein